MAGSGAFSISHAGALTARGSPGGTPPGPTAPTTPARLPRRLLAAAIFVFFVYLLTGPFDTAGAYSALADAFLHGRLYIDHDMPLLELVPAGAGTHQWYVPFPPVPAVVLLPVMAFFGSGVDVGVIAAFAGALNVLLLWVLLEAIGAPSRVRGWLVGAFALGSVEWWVAGMAGTHHDAQVMSVTFALAALNLAVRQRWPLAAGLLLGLAAGSRLPVGLTLPLYVALYAGLTFPPRLASLRDPLPWRRIGGVILGVAIVAIPVAWYNLVRFGSPFDFGYARIASSSGSVLDEPWFSEGILSLSYIPRNLHTMLIRGFDYVDQFPWFRPNWTGMSLLLTTPIYLWLVKARSLTPLVAYGWIAVLLGLLPDITHGSVGFAQFGYRFSLDVAPILWLLLGWVFRAGMSVEAKAAAVLGVVVNAYGILAIWVFNFVSY